MRSRAWSSFIREQGFAIRVNKNGEHTSRHNTSEIIFLFETTSRSSHNISKPSELKQKQYCHIKFKQILKYFEYFVHFTSDFEYIYDFAIENSK